MNRSIQPQTPVALDFPASRRSFPILESHDSVVVLKALGEVTRIRIVGLLLQSPMEVGEIARRLEASNYNVSKHLRILREAGLLVLHKNGRKHFYAVRDEFTRNTQQGRIVDLGCCTFQFGNRR